MQLKHEYKIGGSHSEEGVKRLEEEFGYNFTEEHLEFLSSFPGMSFKGSRLVRLDSDNDIGAVLVHNFLDASDLLYILEDEDIMEAYEALPKEKVEPYCILTISFTNTELLLVGSGSENKNKIYLFSTITDKLFFICEGIENFINNYLYED